jgi:chaperonin GroES
MKMKPIGDLVLLQEHKKEDTTQSGIILVDGIEGDYVYADVIAVGPGLFTQTGDRIPMTVKPGNVVILHKNQSGSNKKIKLEDKQYLLLHESELVMVSV